MKTLSNLFLLIALSIFTVSTSTAQKGMSNGSITYEMSLDEENPMATMMKGTTMKILFKDQKVKTEMNMMGGMVNINIIMDQKKEAGLMLMSMPMMGKNMAVEMTKEDITKMKNDQKVNQKKPKITYYKRKKKKIAGYKCYKVVAEVEGVADPITLYVTDKIKPAGQSQIQQQLSGLKGFPLSYEVKQQGIEMVFTATEVSKKTPDDKLFEMVIPEGFEKTTLEEIGGMGNMGFGL